MNVLGTAILILLIIDAVMLVLFVLIQDEEGDSLGGIFAGGSSSAFGSRSGNVLTRVTSILGALFLILSFTLAMINKTPADSVIKEGYILNSTAGSLPWYEDEAALSPDAESAAPDALEDGVVDEGALEAAQQAGADAEESGAADSEDGAGGDAAPSVGD